MSVFDLQNWIFGPFRSSALQEFVFLLFYMLSFQVSWSFINVKQFRKSTIHICVANLFLMFWFLQYSNLTLLALCNINLTSFLCVQDQLLLILSSRNVKLYFPVPSLSLFLSSILELLLSFLAGVFKCKIQYLKVFCLYTFLCLLGSL